MLPEPTTPEERMIALISSHQGALRAFIFSLMPGSPLVDDVLQQTNLVLWKKASEFDPSRPFIPWSYAIARFQVLAARRDSARERIVFDSELVDLLAAEETPDQGSMISMDNALRECLSKLPEEKRELILSRYHPDSSVGLLAEKRGQTVGAISVELHRIRRMLETCIRGKLNPRLS